MQYLINKINHVKIDADPLLFAQQLSARPSIVSVASEEGTFNIQAQPLPVDFGFVPSLKVSEMKLIQNYINIFVCNN